jgi:hypothetical protein
MVADDATCRNLVQLRQSTFGIGPPAGLGVSAPAA